MYKFIAAFLVVTLVSCPSPTGTVTGVTVSSSQTTVTTSGSSILSATVTGIGVFSPSVSWSIVSGGGSLNLNGSGATFLAPSTASTTIIKATSVQDQSKSGTVTVNTTAPNAGAVIR